MPVQIRVKRELFGRVSAIEAIGPWPPCSNYRQEGQEALKRGLWA